MWNSQTKRPGDPPLSSLGHLQARETGRFVDQLLASNGIDGKNVTWLSSPFLRTLQTSDDMISEMTVTKNANGIRILPECSIFEWDGNENGLWHASLPSLEERWCYFPRLDASHQSLFVPDLPEPRAQFLSRCERAIEAFNSRYPPPGRHAARSAVVMVTHAAGCIGLCRAATQLPLDGIEPAAPCSVYRMTRPSRSRSLSSSPLTSSAWRMDPALNGCVRHLSDLGSHTVPWNHFGNKHKDPHGGYTGPLDSLLVPKSVRNSIAAREMTAEP
jgi:broad specificity phosphatase PhoE